MCRGWVLEFVADQLGVEDPSQVKRYTERRPTPFDHQQEIRQAQGCWGIGRRRVWDKNVGD
jgi:Domain of unknown function (DUF4158)